MKTDLSYLPLNKQAELSRIVEIITTIAASIVPIEMIILFGSYARDSWVEDKYDKENYRYQSDFDFLIIVNTKRECLYSKLEQAIDCKLNQDKTLTTPISVIVHDIRFVNRRLSRAQYFFTDIKKEGVLLYDSYKFKLKESKELSNKERQYLAQEDFKYYFKEADEFKGFIEFGLEKGKLNKAVFLLHQMAERIYTAILLVFTRYKPNTHDLLTLKKMVNSIDSNELLDVFPLDSAENMFLFKLLRKAYIDARYKPSYIITQDQLETLIERVYRLRDIGYNICEKRIAALTI